jgi:hypothetical protein
MGVFPDIRSEKETYEFLNEHYGILLHEWDEAEAEGYTDIVFAWNVMPEGLCTSWAPREEILPQLIEDGMLPDDVREKLSQPAGENRAWMIFTTDEGSASVRVTRVSISARGGSA